MLSKLFHFLPYRYRQLLVATVTAIAIPLIGLAVYFTFPKPPEPSATPTPSTETGADIGNASELTITPTPTDSGTVTSEPVSPAPTIDGSSSEAIQSPPQLEEYAAQYDNPLDTEFNHFPYDEAYRDDIVSIGMFTRESYEREEYLHYEAAAAFQEMKVAAAADGMKIQAISGFRTVARQSELFKNQVAKLGSEAAAAKLSAPPGHSEHHTGYAVDIGDVNQPETDITYEFEGTPAYSWLLANAGRFGFEESFPRGNQQGVSFEPWHWRYIGSEEAASIFAQSRFLP